MRRYHWVRLLSTALIAVWFGIAAAPALADDRKPQSRARSASSLDVNAATTPLAAASGRPGAGVINGFIYNPGLQPTVGIRGRLNVGKSGVYVPYYGNLGLDPNHPAVEGIAGLGYGFRNNWDISVLGGGYTSSVPSGVPGGDPPKNNPSLSISVRF